MPELKGLLTKVERDDCLISSEQDPIRDIKLVGKSVVDSDYRFTSLCKMFTIDAAFYDHAELVVGCCGLGDNF